MQGEMLPIVATSTKPRLAATEKQLPYSAVSPMTYHLIAVLPVVQRAGSWRVALMISLLSTVAGSPASAHQQPTPRTHGTPPILAAPAVRQGNSYEGDRPRQLRIGRRSPVA